MSVGDLKDYGNKGNNFPWQLKMLQGLQQMIDGNATCCQDTMSMLKDISKIISPQTRKINVKSVSDADTVGVDAYSLSIANVGASAGLVNGAPLPAGITLNFDAGALNNRLSGVTYDATGTTFLLTVLTD